MLKAIAINKVVAAAMLRDLLSSEQLPQLGLVACHPAHYTALRDLLAEQKWREAEDETRAKLIEAAGPGAQERNWVYWSEVKKIPVEDMTTLDALWSAASNGKFGYKVQRQMWIQKGTVDPLLQSNRLGARRE
eukprot:jgi/Picre1/34684/NNA_002152.t1